MSQTITIRSQSWNSTEPHSGWQRLQGLWAAFRSFRIEPSYTVASALLFATASGATGLTLIGDTTYTAPANSVIVTMDERPESTQLHVAPPLLPVIDKNVESTPYSDPANVQF